MAGAAAEHEEVPDGVVVREFLEEVDQGAQGVDDAAGQQPSEPARGQGLDEGLDGEDGQPAHEEVGDGGEDLEPVDEEKLEDDPRGGQHPDEAEQRPAPAPLERHEREGCVGARDKQVDARAVNDPEGLLETRRPDGVVEGRGGVQQNERRPVDAAAHDVQGRAVEAGQDHQDTEPRGAQQGARAVGEA